MNTIRTRLLCSTIALVAALLLSTATPAHAAGEQLDAAMSLTATFVTLPDAPAFTAAGKGTIDYALEGSGATVPAAGIPRMVYEADGPPAGLAALTVVISAVQNTKATIDWPRFPAVQLKELDLRVQAYDVEEAEVGGAEPIVDVILSNLTFTTEPVTVEGWEDAGYVDMENLEAQLVSEAILPDHDYPAYDEWLAGEPALLTLRVRMPNPYGK